MIYTKLKEYTKVLLLVTFKNLDKDGDGKIDHAIVEMRNDIGTGSATVKEIMIDGVAVPPEKITLTIGNRPPRSFDPASEIYSEYGDTILFEMQKEGGLTPGEHSLGLRASLGWREQTVTLKGNLV
jgi:hypothetical protein